MTGLVLACSAFVVASSILLGRRIFARRPTAAAQAAGHTRPVGPGRFVVAQTESGMVVMCGRSVWVPTSRTTPPLHNIDG